MELTVLGCSGSFGGAGGARAAATSCAAASTAIWVDCGNGTFVPPPAAPRRSRTHAVVLTHGHPDHCVDIYGLHVLLRYGLERRGLPVYAPEGLDKFLLGLVSDWGDTFDWRTWATATRATVGDIDLRFSRTDHPPPTYAVEAGPRAGAGSIYTADTGPGLDASTRSIPAPTSCCRRRATCTTTGASPIHLSARQAGLAAREAGAQRLVLTHLWPALDPEAVRRRRIRGVRSGGHPAPPPHLVTHV